MSMGHGLMPDAGPLSALSCRSTIMKEADVVMVIEHASTDAIIRRGKWNPNQSSYN